MSVLTNEFLSFADIGSWGMTYTDLALIEHQLCKTVITEETCVENGSNCCNREIKVDELRTVKNPDSLAVDFERVESPEITRRDIANDEIRPSQLSFDSPENNEQRKFNNFCGRTLISPINGDSSLFMMNDEPIDFNTSNIDGSPNESDDMVRYPLLDLRPLDYKKHVVSEINKNSNAVTGYYEVNLKDTNLVSTEPFELVTQDDNNFCDRCDYAFDNDNNNDEEVEVQENVINENSEDNDKEIDAPSTYTVSNSLKFRTKITKQRSIATDRPRSSCNMIDEFRERLKVSQHGIKFTHRKLANLIYNL